MSFRSRLTGFFVMIVVVPMIAFGMLAFTLIDSSLLWVPRSMRSAPTRGG